MGPQDHRTVCGGRKVEVSHVIYAQLVDLGVLIKTFSSKTFSETILNGLPRRQSYLSQQTIVVCTLILTGVRSGSTYLRKKVVGWIGRLANLPPSFLPRLRYNRNIQLVSWVG